MVNQRLLAKCPRVGPDGILVAPLKKVLTQFHSTQFPARFSQQMRGDICLSTFIGSWESIVLRFVGGKWPLANRINAVSAYQKELVPERLHKLVFGVRAQLKDYDKFPRMMQPEGFNFLLSDELRLVFIPDYDVIHFLYFSFFLSFFLLLILIYYNFYLLRLCLFVYKLEFRFCLGLLNFMVRS